MKIKYLATLGTLLFTFCINSEAAATFAYKNEVSASKLNEQLDQVNQQIESVLEEAKKLQEEDRRYDDESTKVEHRDPAEALRFGKLTAANKEKLHQLLLQLEKLLQQREYIRQQLGHPGHEEDSPYQT